MVIRGKEIERKILGKTDIENRIKEGSITAYFESNIVEIKEGEVIIDTQKDQ